MGSRGRTNSSSRPVIEGTVGKYECPVFVGHVLWTSHTDNFGVDQDGCITLTYKNGGRAVLTYSTLFTGKNQATIFGSKGVMKLEESFWCPREATLPSGKVINEIPTGPVSYNFLNGGGLRFEADCVKECLEAGKLECSEVSFADRQALYHIIDEVVKQYGRNVKW